MGNNTEENWRLVVSFPGKNYEVSDHGRVKCISRKSKPLKGVIHTRNRLVVSLKKTNPYGTVICRTLYIHRLVAEAFVLNPHNHKCVKHIDGNTLNNRAENLVWVPHNGNQFI